MRQHGDPIVSAAATQEEGCGFDSGVGALHAPLSMWVLSSSPQSKNTQKFNEIVRRCVYSECE